MSASPYTPQPQRGQPTNTSNRRTSPVYRYIKEVTRIDANGVISTVFVCELCIDQQSARRGEWASANTSNFKKHIQHHHAPEYAEMEPPQRTGACDDSGLPVRPALATTEQARATRTLAKWLVRNSHPFLLVDQELFREFCKILNPSYQVPCRQTIRDHILVTWALEKTQVRSQILLDLRNGHRASLTTDLWTSAARHGYTVVTLQYINADWVVRSVILGFVRVVYPHSGDRLANALLEAVDLVDPRITAALWTVTADNASNNGVMTRSLQQSMEVRYMATDGHHRVHSPPRVVYVRCIAHVFQLAIKEGLKKSPDINAALGGLRELVRKLAESPKLYEKYEEVCKSLSRKPRKFQLDVETRWNSTFVMLRSLLLARPVLEDLHLRIQRRHTGYTDFVSDLPVLDVKLEAWAAARLFRSFLGPFKEATVLMSGRYPTLSAVPSVYSSLQHHVTEHVAKVETRLRELRNAIADPATSIAPTTSTELEVVVTNGRASRPQNAAASSSPGTLNKAKEAAERALKFFQGAQAKLLEYQSMAMTREARIAASLDPRFKAFASDDVRGVLVEEFYLRYNHRFTAESESTAASAANSQLFSPPSKYPRLMALMVQVSGSPLPRRKRVSIEEEVEDWFREPGVRMDFKSREVCDWFRTSASGFPRLRMMAREFLAIPATSVPSEIAFSAAGNTIRDRRAALNDQSVTAISELQSFIKFNTRKDQEPDSEDEQDDPISDDEDEDPRLLDGDLLQPATEVSSTHSI